MLRSVEGNNLTSRPLASVARVSRSGAYLLYVCFLQSKIIDLILIQTDTIETAVTDRTCFKEVAIMFLEIGTELLTTMGLKPSIF